MRTQLTFRTVSFLAAALILLPLLAGCTSAAPAAPSPAPAATLAATAPASASVAQPAATPAPLEGRWEGTLKLPGQELKLIVRYTGSGSALKAVMDVPAQAAMDIPLTKVSQDGARVHFEAFAGPRLARFDGELKADGTLAGDFQQAGFKGPLVFQRVAAQPTAVVPYLQETVTYKNGDVTLACTLSKPPIGGPFPAVMLITGSGAQNRDEDLGGMQPFRLIADHLTLNGFAVLRCDDRGVGGSTGDVISSTSEDFAGDILAGVNTLKARPDINPKKIGLWGHSEGGIIAPIVASRSADVAFIVLMSGPGLPGEQILKTQLVDIMKAGGSSQADIDKAAADQARTLDAIKTGKGWDALKAEWAKAAKERVAAMPTDQVQGMGGADKAVEGIVQAQYDSANSPWFKFFVTYDPAPALARVNVPVLALFGGKDTQVKTEPNEAAIRAALASGGNQKLTVKVFADANHLYQQAGTGSPNEYTRLKKEFIPGFLEYTTDWIQSVLK